MALVAKMMKQSLLNDPVMKNVRWNPLSNREQLDHTDESGECGVFILRALVRLLCVSFSCR